MKENYGNELRRIREEKLNWSLSQAEMASGISRSYICRLENSKRNRVSLDVICLLADAYKENKLELISKLI